MVQKTSFCPETVELMKGFQEEFTANDFMNGNVNIIDNLYCFVFNQYERDRIYDARKD